MCEIVCQKLEQPSQFLANNLPASEILITKMSYQQSVTYVHLHYEFHHPSGKDGHAQPRNGSRKKSS
jgi:hypothetical protein